MSAPAEVSLWLVPPQPVHDVLQTLIDEFSAATDTAPFAPHLTILGDIAQDPEAVCAQTRKIAAATQPFSLRFATPAFGETVFQSLFLRAVEDKPRGGPVQSLHDTAKGVFKNADTPPVFDPHLSLAYGTIARATKERLGAIASRVLPLTFPVCEIHVVRASKNIPIPAWRVLNSLELGKTKWTT